MHEVKDKAAWERAITEFRAAYPGQYFDTDNARAYRTLLLFFDIQDVVKGLQVAAGEHPGKRPPAGVVRDITRRVEKERKMGQTTAEQPDMWDNPAARVEDKQTYIDAGDTEYERFARQCEVNSLRVLTRAEQHERIRKFNELVGKVGVEVTDPAEVGT